MPGADVAEVTFLAIVQSVALAATLVLVWVSIALAEDLHADSVEDPTPVD